MSKSPRFVSKNEVILYLGLDYKMWNREMYQEGFIHGKKGKKNEALD
jgi:hypothetical protein